MSPCDLFHALLDWPAGRFQFASRDIDAPDDFSTTSTALLLDHARLTDENG
jgi:hypothetical protein